MFWIIVYHSLSLDIAELPIVDHEDDGTLSKLTVLSPDISGEGTYGPSYDYHCCLII